MRIIKTLLIGAALAAMTTTPAKAEVFQWRDPVTQMTVTYPDEWRKLANQQPDDVWTVVAPGANDAAECRLRVNEDKRFVIFPREYVGAIQRTNVSKDFWDTYIGQYKNGTLNRVVDNAGLGEGFASYAEMSFATASGPKVDKQGIAFATIYNDKAFVFECSAQVNAYAKWHPSFLSVLKSVDFRKEYAQNINGHYRPFQDDKKIHIHNERPIDLFVY